MGDVRAGEVVAVHLLTVRVDVRLDKEAWPRDAGAAPDDVNGFVVVPICGF